MIKKLLFGIGIGFVQFIMPTYQTITSSGQYVLGNNVAYDPGLTSNDAIFYIAASDVILDLGNNIIAQSGSTAGLMGVEIASGISNISIKNGIISGVTGAAIYVNQGCSNLSINNLDLLSSGTRGIEFAGASGSNQIVDSLIDSIKIFNCGTTVAGMGILLTQCSKVGVSNVIIADSGAASLPFVGLRLATCIDCDIDSLKIVTDTGTTITGIDVNNSTRCSFADCIVRNCSATSAMVAYSLNGAANTYNVFQNCAAVQNAALGATFNGFYLQANSQANVFKECLVLANSGVSSNGVQLTGGGANNNNNSFLDCLIQNNISTTGDSVGYNINGSDYGLMKNCIASFNTSTGAIAVGLRFSSGTGGSNWYIQENQFVRNIGSSSANSYGVSRLTGSTNWFSQNIAFNNGTTTSNQMNGVAGGSTINRNTNNVNANQGLTNVQAVP